MTPHSARRFWPSSQKLWRYLLSQTVWRGAQPTGVVGQIAEARSPGGRRGGGGSAGAPGISIYECKSSRCGQGATATKTIDNANCLRRSVIRRGRVRNRCNRPQQCRGGAQSDSNSITQKARRPPAASHERDDESLLQKRRGAFRVRH